MSKRHKHPPVNLRDFLDRQEREGCVPVQGTSETWLVRPPQLLSDDDYRAFVASDDEVEQAKLMMGEADYEAFVADGGSAMILGMILAEALEAEQAEQGASAGESGASSSS